MSHQAPKQPDDKLAKIFGKPSVSMFEMNKHLSAHLTAKKN